MSPKSNEPNIDSNSIDSEQTKIVAVDLQPMAPINGVLCIQGDITSYETAQAILAPFDGNERAQLVICDGAPDVTGLHDLDEYLQSQLLISAVKITTHVLVDGGTFVAKIFRGRHAGQLYAQLRLLFERVSIAKPTSSRNSSLESFVVCQQFKGGEEFRNLPLDRDTVLEGDKIHPSIPPFLACGDLSGWGEVDGFVMDADKSYPMDEKDYIATVTPPIMQPHHAQEHQKKEQEDQDDKRYVVGLQHVCALYLAEKGMFCAVCLLFVCLSCARPMQSLCPWSIECTTFDQALL
jgi:tRNA (cytidine32/guanosine34-2'-O)-methyltransferase